MPRRPKYCTSDEDFRKLRNEWRKKNYRKTAGDDRKRRWTKEENMLVLAHDIPDVELAKQINRSAQAIQTRRYLLKHNQV